jgi:hypothetical protein
MPSSFRRGDVVERVRAGVSAAAGATIDKGTLGTICRVVTPGRTYKVRYADFDMCLTVFHDSIRKAPSGSVGPECEADC